MRRDIVHYYGAPVDRVFEAYRRAAFEKFGKNSQAQPFHTVSFGLNMSFKYNMNGGSCNVHLIPYQQGTAVDVRYTIVQLAGARFGAYDAELTKYVAGILGVQAQDLKLDVDVFLDPKNQVAAAPAQQAAAPAQAAAPVIAAQPQAQGALPKKTFCRKCGAQLEAGDLFCGSCGNRIGN